jgi:hypothetical protein
VAVEDENGYFKRVTDDMKMSGMDSKEAMECLPREGWCGLGVNHDSHEGHYHCGCIAIPFWIAIIYSYLGKEADEP